MTPPSPGNDGRHSPFTIAVIPDTQEYTTSRTGAQIFRTQTSWIAAHVAELGIALVLHEGDLVDNVNSEEEWHIATQAMGQLNGVVPYVIAAGNHDLIRYREGGAGSKAVPGQYIGGDRFDEFFPMTTFLAQNSPTFEMAGSFDGQSHNTYSLFSAGGADYLLINIEFGARDEVLAWADGIAKAHAGRPAILLTHDYLGSDDELRGSRDCSGYPAGVECVPEDALPGGPGGTPMPSPNTGLQMWEKLVATNSNIVMTLNGHIARVEESAMVDGVRVTVRAKSTAAGATGRRITTRPDGTVVAQMLANYQMMMPTGGDGYLRLITVEPGAGTLSVRTYSPWLDRYLTDDGNEFTVTGLALGA